ncbi:putative DMT superfamily transporter inner membrane protein [Marinomonas spartinae]|uniref:Putative DMT superfamily transporter inner membrane protein n=1 Tax=Marinomonas spartinae TaxID=1792290 RepID=A0A1A8TRJ6_9GAMM|nr:DMT family transporter [Marinomonas spartinae]SBS35544.1 putative DMT superfamily transporter inner membrane protein [Marinomonas spartinae]
MLISQLFLWTTAAIWGFAFVAQTVGMDSLGPYSFNAARFLLATLSLLPLLFIFKSKQQQDKKHLWLGGILGGTCLFFGFTFQQVGLQYTTAGNAGFITSMYIVFVPIVGILLKHKVESHTWLGIILALIGLYCLTIGPHFNINKGDAIELIGTLFWTGHVIIIGYFSRYVSAVPLSIIQFLIATILGTVTAFFTESPALADFEMAWWPLVYAGVASSGIAFTLQTLGQRNVSASISALILSSEAVFALIGGWLLMNEVLSTRTLIGCGFILLGMIISQWPRQTKAAAISVA